MNFASYEFIFVFFPLALCGYYFLCKYNEITKINLQVVFLIIVSTIFISIADINASVCLWISALVNYSFLKLLSKYRSRLILYIGVISNVGFLAYFKYTNFIIENVNTILGTKSELLDIVLPIGVSFYTFQQILFLVEYYREEKDDINFLNYMMSVIFFPKIVSGPIMSYIAIKEMNSKLKKTVQLNYINISAGLYLFSIGLFKKCVIADTIAYFVNNGYGISENINFWQAWCTTLCYTLQIYFDFSGYSDMAVGIARAFGISLPFNFNSPYHAVSITDFWRRWHITLSRALSRLIYIPLGGNRKGTVRMYVNIMATFLVSGIWHGASWTFIVWGIAHGLISVFERIFIKYITKIPKLIRQTGTFAVVNFLWVLFRAESFNQALEMFKGMFSVPNFKELEQLSVLANDGIIPFPNILWILYLITILAVLLFMICKKHNSNDIYMNFNPTKANLVYAFFLFIISILHLSQLANFVYVNF